jgi:sugar phosphate isomerase/epimerase
MEGARILSGMTNSLPVARPVTFMAGSLARTPFREQVAAAATAGFGGITCWPNIWRHAQRRDSLTVQDMRAMLDDNGLVITDVDACSDWAAPSPVDVPLPSAPRVEFFDVGDRLGATTVVATHTIGGGLATDREVAGFALLCDEAAVHGLRIALEYVPFTGVPDLPAALRILGAVDRPNAGLVVDLGHHARSGGGPDDLRVLRPEQVFTVQLADGPLRQSADLLEDAMSHRQLPGSGEFPLVDCLRVLADIGVRAPTGPEVYRPECADRPATEVAAELYRSTVDLLQRV